MPQKSSKHFLISIFFRDGEGDTSLPDPPPARHFVPRSRASPLFMTIHAPPLPPNPGSATAKLQWNTLIIILTSFIVHRIHICRVWCNLLQSLTKVELNGIDKWMKWCITNMLWSISHNARNQFRQHFHVIFLELVIPQDPKIKISYKAPKKVCLRSHALTKQSR